MDIRIFGFLLTAALIPATVSAQEAEKDWQFEVGAGLVGAPAFKGSDEYQLSAVPMLSVHYKDKLFASLQEGLGYNLVNSNGWRAGPILRYAFERKEDGDSNPFKIAGSDTDALRGLGDVDDTWEPGGFVEYSWKEWSGKVEIRQGIGGHEGLIGDVSANYTKDIGPMLRGPGAPLYISLGPRATVVSDDYNQTYYGVDGLQSARSGLRQYDADGGLLSYGAGAMAIVPLSETVITRMFVGYDRLSGDAADSPLVQDRGSANQGMAGVSLAYKFGL